MLGAVDIQKLEQLKAIQQAKANNNLYMLAAEMYKSQFDLLLKGEISPKELAQKAILCAKEFHLSVIEDMKQRQGEAANERIIS